MAKQSVTRGETHSHSTPATVEMHQYDFLRAFFSIQHFAIPYCRCMTDNERLKSTSHI